MKLFKLCDDLIINIEHLYALGKESNKDYIDEWNKQYNEYIDNAYKNPIELVVDGFLFTPNFNEKIDDETLKKYTDALNKYIIENIGEKPEYKEEYYTILSNGNRVYLSKEVYNLIKKYIEDNFEIMEA